MPKGVRIRSELERVELFWSNVDATGPCWQWTAGRSQGYGRCAVAGGRMMLAHQWAYEHLVGPVPGNMTLDHLCRNRACVNPDHLEVVTRGVNALRGTSPLILAHRQRRCPRGHKDWAPNGRKGVTCRVCKRERERARRAA